MPDCAAQSKVLAKLDARRCWRVFGRGARLVGRLAADHESAASNVSTSHSSTSTSTSARSPAPSSWPRRLRPTSRSTTRCGRTNRSPWSRRFPATAKTHLSRGELSKTPDRGHGRCLHTGSATCVTHPGRGSGTWATVAPVPTLHLKLFETASTTLGARRADCEPGRRRALPPVRRLRGGLSRWGARARRTPRERPTSH